MKEASATRAIVGLCIRSCCRSMSPIRSSCVWDSLSCQRPLNRDAIRRINGLQLVICTAEAEEKKPWRLLQRVQLSTQELPFRSLASAPSRKHRMSPMLRRRQPCLQHWRRYFTSMKVGYRHFDTASLYISEGFLGEALKEAMQAGSVKREDLFVTSKLWCSDAYPEGVLPALQKSLSELQLDYLDLYLIHWPVRFKETVGHSDPTKPDDLLPLDLKGTWRAMEACVRQGLTKAIGVSNFSSKKIAGLLEFAEIPPAVNQVEMHPMWQQKQLRETCKRLNVHVSAWSPLGAPQESWGSAAILDQPVLKEIAAKLGKTPAQVALRWELDNGVSVLPKSFNKARMAQNLQALGWRLSDEDHAAISKLKQKKNLPGTAYCHPDIGPFIGPFRSLEDLWDGEI